MIKEALSKIVSRSDLTLTEAREVMREIMRGETTQAQIGAFLTALRMKGETLDEIAGCAQAMRESAIPVKPNRNQLVDTCGTGGDGSGTFSGGFHNWQPDELGHQHWGRDQGKRAL